MMKENNNVNRIQWVDPLRVLATFSVIFLHASAPLVAQFGTISNSHWWVGNIYDSMVRFCVPIFLMISGALILPKTYESTKIFLKKRVLRIIPPFLLWSFIYIVLLLADQIHNGENFTSTEILRYIFHQLKNGASYHLWYIYLIIGLYLFFPIIQGWINNRNRKEIKYFLIIWLITIIISIPYVNIIKPAIEISYFSGFIGYPILGYYLSTSNFEIKKKKATYISLILLGVVVTMFGTYFLSNHLNSFTETFYDYLTLNVILASAGVFLLFKDYVRIHSKIIKFLSKYSYGTYLAHALVLTVLKKIGISYAFIHPIIGIPVASVLCLIISTLIIYGINKLPLGKYISG